MNFKVRFTVYDEYVKPRDTWKVIKKHDYGTTTYEAVTDCIETSDWNRKGSIAVDNVFIHDDYRSSGDEESSDCRLFVNIENNWIELKPRQIGVTG